MRNFYNRHFKKIVVILLVLALVQVIFSLTAGISDEVQQTIPWLVVGTIITEGLFIAGLVMMAVSAEHALGRNPLKWKSHLREIAKKVNRSRLFWYGFWVNAIGALGTGFLWLWAILFTIPSAWGALLLPAGDIFLTIVLRLAIYDARKALLKPDN